MKGIYCWRNKKNNKRLVGQTLGLNGFQGRATAYLHQLRKGTYENKHFQNAWNKYGEENFVFEILEVLEDFDKKHTTIREQHWCDYYKSSDREFGYNRRKCVESNLGMKMPPKTDKFIEWARINNTGKKNSMYGKDPWNKGLKTGSLSKEHKEKISKSTINKRKSEKTKRKMSENNRTRILNIEDVINIRDLFSKEEKPSQTKIAQIYGVKQPAIWKIVNRISWKHV